MIGIKRSLLTLLKWLFIIELGYLLLINLALQLPLTQTLVNQIRLEKFHVAWESALLPHFPIIEGWEIAPADTSPRNTKQPWKLSIDNATASGVHKIWIFNINGGGSGDLEVDLSFETRGVPPFSLHARELDLTLDPAYLNGEPSRERRKENTLKIEIKEATVVDMTIANDYLPETASIAITGGTAKLTADIFVEPEDATGWLRLTSTDLELKADQQALEGNLDLDVVVAGGVPREMRLEWPNCHRLQRLSVPSSSWRHLRP